MKDLTIYTYILKRATLPCEIVVTVANDQGSDLQKNLRKNPKFIISFSYVYLKFILSYIAKIFVDFFMKFTKAILRLTKFFLDYMQIILWKIC